MKYRSLIMRVLLLFATLWQAPVPYCHSHEMDSDAPVGATVVLADHLRRYHADDSCAAEGVQGWHFHLTMPDSESDSSEPESSGQRQIMLESAAADWTYSLERSLTRVARLFQHELVAVPDVPPRGRSTGCPDLPRGFFSSFAPSMPLPVRLGVLRC